PSPNVLDCTPMNLASESPECAEAPTPASRKAPAAAPTMSTTGLFMRLETPDAPQVGSPCFSARSASVGREMNRLHHPNPSGCPTARAIPSARESVRAPASPNLREARMWRAPDARGCAPRLLG